MERTYRSELLALVAGVAFGVVAGVGLSRLGSTPQSVTATLVLEAPPTPKDASAATPPGDPAKVVAGVRIEGPRAQGNYVVLVYEPAESGCARPASAFVQPIGDGSASIQFDPHLASRRVSVLTSLAANVFQDGTKAPCLDALEVAPASSTGARAVGYKTVSAEQGLSSIGCNTSKPPNFQFRLCLDPRSEIQLHLSEVSDVR